MLFSLGLDILSILIIVFCVIYYYKKGFFSGLVRLVGGVLSLILSASLSKFLANWFFDNFYKTKLEEMFTQNIQNQATGESSILEQVLNFLPSQLASGLRETVGQETEKVASAYSESIVTSMIGPLVIPVIQVSVFAVCLCLFLFLFRLLSKLFTGINNVPLIGGANQILGGVVGVFMGALVVYVVFCVLWIISIMLDGSTFSTSILPESYVYKIFEPINILAKMFE